MPEYIYMVYLGTSKFNKEHFNGINPEYTHTQIQEKTITEINSVLRENLSSETYRSDMHHMMIYAFTPVIGEIANYTYATVLMIRTLKEIHHHLFRTCEQAFNEMKLRKIYTFDDIYDGEYPGMRFNHLFKGTFFGMDEQNEVKFNPQS